MSDLFVILHVLAAILLMGPIMISTSMFAPQLRKAAGGDTAAKGGLQLIARITRSYGFISLLVPALGFVAFFTVDGAMQRYNFHAAALLAVLAWIMLIAVIIPNQRRAALAVGAQDEIDAEANPQENSMATQVDTTKAASQSAMFAGIFNLLWLITAVLMFF